MLNDIDALLLRDCPRCVCVCEFVISHRGRRIAAKATRTEGLAVDLISRDDVQGIALVLAARSSSCLDGPTLHLTPSEKAFKNKKREEKGKGTKIF